MKIDNGKHNFEKRRKRIFTPALYMLAEIILVWLILSIINISFQIQTWGEVSHLVLFAAFLYSAKKACRIYDRQKSYQLAWEDILLKSEKTSS